MATPALTRYGSDELKRNFLAPSIAGDILACLGVSEVGSGSDVASIKTTALPKRGQDFWNACSRISHAQTLRDLCLTKTNIFHDYPKRQKACSFVYTKFASFYANNQVHVVICTCERAVLHYKIIF